MLGTEYSHLVHLLYYSVKKWKRKKKKGKKQVKINVLPVVEELYIYDQMFNITWSEPDADLQQ